MTRSAPLALALLTSAGVALAQSPYRLEIVAKSGTNGLLSIDRDCTINQRGWVAFVANQDQGSGVYPNVFADIGIPNSARSISPSVTTANSPQLGPGLQINDTGLVVIRRFVSIPSPLGAIPVSTIETWDSRGTDVRNTLVYGEPLLGQFDGVYNYPSLANNGSCVFAALDNGGNFLGTLTVSGGFRVSLLAPLPKPMMADSDRFVMRLGSDKISLFPPAFFPNVTLAGPNDGFSTVGERPGIADDGTVVAFSGDRGPGAGIFASVPVAGTRQLIRIAGEGADAFQGFAMDERIGAETSEGEWFRVVFIGTQNGVQGLYSVEARAVQDPVTNQWLCDCQPAELVLEAGTVLPAGSTGQSAGTVQAIHTHDPLNRGGDIACHVDLTSGGQAVVRARQSTVRFVDAADANFRTATGVVGDPLQLVSGGEPRLGVAADGVARLVVRSRLPGLSPGGQATVSLQFPGSGDHGSIYAPGQPASTTQVQVAAVRSRGEDWAVAVYRAPSEFVRRGNSGDVTALVRSVTVQVSYPTATGTEIVEKELRIVRPPVVLCHGLWSSAVAWDGFAPFVSDPRYSETLVRVDYEATHASPYAENMDEVPTNAHRARAKMNEREIACAQVDWVGHSMGGILARYYAANGDYRRIDNYSEGDIHKLITINTPHWGSPGANLLMFLQQSLGQDFIDLAEQINKPVHKGAVRDLAEGSVELGKLGQTRIPTHAIAGDGGAGIINLGSNLISVVAWLTPPPVRPLLGLFAHAVGLTNSLLFRGQDHDLVVLLNSQLGGLPTSKTSTFGGFSSNHLSVTGMPAVALRVIDLLHQPARGAGSPFATSVPAPNLNPPRLAAMTPPQRLSSSLSLSSNAPGPLVPGQSIVVTATPAVGLTPTTVMFFGPDDQAQAINQAPWQATFTVPVDAAGPVTFTASAFDGAGGVAFATQPLTLPVAVSATALTLEPVNDAMFFRNPLSMRSLALRGTFSDGVDRVLTGAPGVTYASTHPNIASVDAGGIVRPVNAGVADITATYRGLSAVVRVTVDFDPVVSYGAGTPGTGSITPRLDVVGTPSLGSTSFAFDVTQAAGGVLGLLAIGNRADSLALGSLRVLVEPGPAMAVQLIAVGGAAGQAGAGSVQVPITVPAAPAFLGESFFCQALFADSGAAGGVSATQGLRIVVVP